MTNHETKTILCCRFPGRVNRWKPYKRRMTLTFDIHTSSVIYFNFSYDFVCLTWISALLTHLATSSWTLLRCIGVLYIFLIYKFANLVISYIYRIIIKCSDDIRFKSSFDRTVVLRRRIRCTVEEVKIMTGHYYFAHGSKTAYGIRESNDWRVTDCAARTVDSR